MKRIYFRAWQSRVLSRDGIKKWFPVLVKKKKTISTLEIARKTADKSSVTVGDVFNVIHNFFSVLSEEVLDGYSVHVDGFGTFTAVIHSKGHGVNTPEEVNSSQIAELNIRFTPEYTRNPVDGKSTPMFEGVTFERLDK